MREDWINSTTFTDLRLLYRESTQVQALKTSFADEIREVKRERDSLEQQLEIEKTALTAEKKKTLALQEQVKERDRKLIQAASGAGESHTSTPRSSPTPSLSRLSMTGSLNESFSGSQWGVGCCKSGDIFVLSFLLVILHMYCRCLPASLSNHISLFVVVVVVVCCCLYFYFLIFYLLNSSSFSFFHSFHFSVIFSFS